MSWTLTSDPRSQTLEIPKDDSKSNSIYTEGLRLVAFQTPAMEATTVKCHFLGTFDLTTADASVTWLPILNSAGTQLFITVSASVAQLVALDDEEAAQISHFPRVIIQATTTSAAVPVVQATAKRTFRPVIRA